MIVKKQVFFNRIFIKNMENMQGISWGILINEPDGIEDANVLLVAISIAPGSLSLVKYLVDLNKIILLVDIIVGYMFKVFLLRLADIQTI
jgi:hypothetical protein